MMISVLCVFFIAPDCMCIVSASLTSLTSDGCRFYANLTSVFILLLTSTTGTPRKMDKSSLENSTIGGEREPSTSTVEESRILNPDAMLLQSVDTIEGGHINCSDVCCVPKLQDSPPISDLVENLFNHLAYPDTDLEDDSICEGDSEKISAHYMGTAECAENLMWAFEYGCVEISVQTIAEYKFSIDIFYKNMII